MNVISSHIHADLSVHLLLLLCPLRSWRMPLSSLAFSSRPAPGMFSWCLQAPVKWWVHCSSCISCFIPGTLVAPLVSHAALQTNLMEQKVDIFIKVNISSFHTLFFFSFFCHMHGVRALPCRNPGSSAWWIPGSSIASLSNLSQFPVRH